MAASTLPRRLRQTSSLGRVRVWLGRVRLTAALADVAAMALLALSPRLYFWRLFASNSADQMTIVEGDFSQEYFPVLLTAARALRDGALPLWNPYSNGGQPLLADPQASLLYPPTWLALFQITGYDGQSFVALEQLIPLHFALCGIFSYWLGRAILGSRLGALTLATVFTYSGYLTSFPVQQLPILRAVTWFPLQALALWLALERRSVPWAGLAGFAFGMAVLAGHPQTAFLEAVGLGLIAGAWAVGQGHRMGWPRSGARAAGMLALVGLLGLGLSAAQWLPTLEFTRLSSRSEVGYEFLSAGFTLWELPLDLLAPRVLGGLPPYVGVLTLLLAAVALTTGWRRPYGPALALLVGGLLLSLGGHSFLYPAVYVLAPGFDLFRHQERAIFLFSLGAAVLAGSGAALLSSRFGDRERAALAGLRRWAAGSLAVALVLGGGLYLGLINAEVANQATQRWRDIVHWYFFFVLMLAGSLALLTARTARPGARVIVSALLLPLLLLDLFSVSWLTNLQDRRPEDVFRASEIVKRLQADIGLDRADDQGVLNGNHGLVYGIPTITRSFPLHLQRLDHLLERLPQSLAYDLLNVRYVVTREPRPEYGQVILTEQWQDITNVLLERPSGPGPAIVVPTALSVSTPDEALRGVSEPDFDPMRQVVLEGAPTDSLQRGGEGRVHSYARDWNHATLRVSAEQGGYLVLSETYYPGWRASVDGVEQPIMRANYLLRSIWIPPGEHEVEFRFVPDSLHVGLAISSLTVLVLVAVGGVLLVRAVSRRRFA